MRRLELFEGFVSVGVVSGTKVLVGWLGGCWVCCCSLAGCFGVSRPALRSKTSRATEAFFTVFSSDSESSAFFTGLFVGDASGVVGAFRENFCGLVDGDFFGGLLTGDTFAADFMVFDSDLVNLAESRLGFGIFRGEACEAGVTAILAGFGTSGMFGLF